ncbi:MAG: alpha-glucan family phosphorylase, partial [Bacteroidota bacterium]|nr:alpha-glucan family phosphorylase [Bacteroidota bacterium]
WLRIKISLSGYTVWLRTWQVQVGRIKLYLLDSNDLANLPEHRGITNELYGGGSETRIQQEIILGIGGWRLLRAIGFQPEVCHMNEGHAAFLVLERAADLMAQHKITFAQALAVTRAGNLFTTHTAVAAGFDHFSPSLMWQFLGTYATETLGIDFNALLALGRKNPNDYSEGFNMAYLAIRGSGAVNGVSQLHGEVSRNMFSSLFPRWPEPEVPIGSVTNGVHMPSWDSKEADQIWTRSCGKDRWRGGLETLERDIASISNEDLWEFRNISRKTLVDYIRKKFHRQVKVSGIFGDIGDIEKEIFDPQTLTLGFARRFVPYKRPNLLLHDPDRLIQILTNPAKPVQLVIAGKAPPYDESGKALIREWIQFIQYHKLYKHVIFLSDYDMLLTQQFVQGVDVWINTPRRPWEACGTSGMKVLVNGGINLSELDGWWAEAYSPERGWALGDRKEHGDNHSWDTHEADELYHLLENDVVPGFYNRNEKDIPVEWVNRIRRSMAELTPRYSANRTVRQYTENYYLPAARKYLKRVTHQAEEAKKLLDIHNDLRNKWGGIQFRNLIVERIEGGYTFKVQVFLNGINNDYLAAELYANGLSDSDPEKIKMEGKPGIVGRGEYIFVCTVITTRPSGDYTPRIYPNYLDVVVPLEDSLILWQR